MRKERIPDLPQITHAASPVALFNSTVPTTLHKYGGNGQQDSHHGCYDHALVQSRDFFIASSINGAVPIRPQQLRVLIRPYEFHKTINMQNECPPPHHDAPADST